MGRIHHRLRARVPGGHPSGPRVCQSLRMPDACVFCLNASREIEVSAVRETTRVLAITDIDLRHARARGGRTHRWHDTGRQQ